MICPFLPFVTMKCETLLTEVCCCIVSFVQPLSGEIFAHQSSNVDDGARVDLKQKLVLTAGPLY